MTGPVLPQVPLAALGYLRIEAGSAAGANVPAIAALITGSGVVIAAIIGLIGKVYVDRRLQASANALEGARERDLASLHRAYDAQIEEIKGSLRRREMEFAAQLQEVSNVRNRLYGEVEPAIRRLADRTITAIEVCRFTARRLNHAISASSSSPFVERRERATRVARILGPIAAGEQLRVLVGKSDVARERDIRFSLVLHEMLARIVVPPVHGPDLIGSNGQDWSNQNEIEREAEVRSALNTVVDFLIENDVSGGVHVEGVFIAEVESAGSDIGRAADFIARDLLDFVPSPGELNRWSAFVEYSFLLSLLRAGMLSNSDTPDFDNAVPVDSFLATVSSEIGFTSEAAENVLKAVVKSAIDAWG